MQRLLCLQLAPGRAALREPRAACTQTSYPTPAVATAFACVLRPGAIVAVTFGMPDIGGVALVVLALHLGDRLVTALTLSRSGRRGDGNRRGAQVGGGSVCDVPVSPLVSVCSHGRGNGDCFGDCGHSAPRWKCGPCCLRHLRAGAAALGLLASPVIITWLADWRSHDYLLIYSGYNYDLSELLRRFGEWYGWGVAVAALAASAILFRLNPENRPLRLTIVSGIIAGALQLHVQSPSLQHFYLVLPLLTATFALALVALRSDWRSVMCAELPSLIATLTPIGGVTLCRLHIADRRATASPARRTCPNLMRLNGWIAAHDVAPATLLRARFQCDCLGRSRWRALAIHIPAVAPVRRGKE